MDCLGGASEADPERGFVQMWFIGACLQEHQKPSGGAGQGRAGGQAKVCQVSPPAGQMVQRAGVSITSSGQAPSGQGASKPRHFQRPLATGKGAPDGLRPPTTETQVQAAGSVCTSRVGVWKMGKRAKGLGRVKPTSFCYPCLEELSTIHVPGPVPVAALSSAKCFRTVPPPHVCSCCA